jgi:histidine ammonia-lyase
LAHLALPLIGRGEVRLDGRRLPALVALRELDIDPLVLEAKEGLALLNGTQLMSAVGALALADAERLLRTASIAAAMSVEALLGTDVAFAAAYQLARPHPGQIRVAAQLPTGGGRVISGGNFHGEPVALALDFAKLALAELGSISERRIALLTDAKLSGGLPPFLTEGSGLDSGMMLLQYTAAALVSENKVLAHPATVDSIPTSANQEDHVSMGAIAARHLRTVVEHVQRIIAIELLCAAQAIDLRLARAPGLKPGAGVLEAHARIRAQIAHLGADREHGPDLAAAFELVRSGALADLA